MLTTALSQITHQSRFTRWMMILALIFAAWHVSLHEVDLAGSDLNECQVCTLSQTSLLGHSNPAVLQAAFTVVSIQVISAIRPATATFFSPWQARAPPLA